jgi:hypothetical protein
MQISSHLQDSCLVVRDVSGKKIKNHNDYCAVNECEKDTVPGRIDYCSKSRNSPARRW